MSHEEFRLIRDLVYAHCGILVRDDMKFVMERRLAPRLEALGVADFGGYHRYLVHDVARRAELDNAIELLTTNETYFFREPMQLRAFSEELLPMLHAHNASTRKLRVWSAGCSTGEEVYTLAMLVNASGLFTGWDVQVHGTDIARRVLTVARKAEYGPSSLRVAPPSMVTRFFEPAGARMRVREEIRAMTSFGQLNLLDPAAGHLVPRCDVVFCRNVMIYFDLSARKRVLQLFYDRLMDGGFLLLGHSESLINVTADFELVHLKDDLVYRRPERRP